MTEEKTESTDQSNQSNQLEKNQKSAETPNPSAEKIDEVKTKEEIETKPQKPEPSGKFKELIKQIENLSVLELSELVKELENRFGVSATAPMVTASATAPAGGDGEESEVEEKTEFSVILKSAGDQKINVIKAVREITTLGLKDAKDLVDAAPKEIKTNLKKEEADDIKKKLEAVGAQVELK